MIMKSPSLEENFLAAGRSPKEKSLWKASAVAKT